MKYVTQIVPCIEQEDMVEFCIHDTDAGTVEKVVCTKEAAPMLHKHYADSLNK